MTQAAAHRVTVDGTEYSYSGIIVEVSCVPTYATSHRWNWPDERGVMRCACGRDSTDSADGVDWACSIHAIALGIWRPDRVKTDWYDRFVGAGLYVDPQYRSGDPVEAERQRCERLGVEWAGPDVQDAPPWTPEEGYALGISSAEIEEAWNEYVGRHGLTVYRDPMRQEVVIDEIDAAEELRAELADDAENEQAFKLAHPGESCAWREHGNIVRLGCPEREADGVTALR